MTKGLFREGGPHHVKRIGDDQHQISITIPKDEDGRVARECPNNLCSPAYFKVTPGTGITEGQDFAYCPYCKYRGCTPKPQKFPSIISIHHRIRPSTNRWPRF